jgi:hypothetical protein
MTISDASKLLSKEVNYMGHISILKDVRQINERLIIGETEDGIIANIILFKVKNGNGKWSDIE